MLTQEQGLSEVAGYLAHGELVEPGVVRAYILTNWGWVRGCDFP